MQVTKKPTLTLLFILISLFLTLLFTQIASADVSSLTNSTFGTADGSILERTVTVGESDFPADAVLADVNVTVDLHKEDDETCDSIYSDDDDPYDEELAIQIISPSGTTVRLVIAYDTYTGDVIPASRTLITFDDQATTPVGGPVIVSGTFQPEEPLSTFNRESPFGTWTLLVEDQAVADFTCFYSFTLEISDVFNVTNLGLAQIGVGQVQLAYQSPNGDVIRINGSELFLPQDADRNGYDTYIIGEIRTVDEVVWVGLFMGGSNLAWVRFDDVVAVTYVDID